MTAAYRLVARAVLCVCVNTERPHSKPCYKNKEDARKAPGKLRMSVWAARAITRLYDNTVSEAIWRRSLLSAEPRYKHWWHAHHVARLLEYFHRRGPNNGKYHLYQQLCEFSPWNLYSVTPVI